MKYTFNQIIEKPSKEVINITVGFLSHAAEKARMAEKHVAETTGKPFSVLDASNLIVYDRWGHSKNRNIGVSKAPSSEFEQNVIKALREQGLCESTKKKNQ